MIVGWNQRYHILHRLLGCKDGVFMPCLCGFPKASVKQEAGLARLLVWSSKDQLIVFTKVEAQGIALLSSCHQLVQMACQSRTTGIFTSKHFPVPPPFFTACETLCFSGWKRWFCTGFGKIEPACCVPSNHSNFLPWFIAVSSLWHLPELD